MSWPSEKKCTYHHLIYIGPYCKIYCPEIVLWQRNNFFILNTGHNGKKEHCCNCMYSKKFKKYEKLDKVILLHKSNCNKNICKYKYNIYFIMIMKFTIILFLYSTALLPYIMQNLRTMYWMYYISGNLMVLACVQLYTINCCSPWVLILSQEAVFTTKNIYAVTPL